MSATIAGQLRAMENAVGIVQLRTSDDEWSRKQGNAMLPSITSEVLLAQVAVLALEVRQELTARAAVAEVGGEVA